MHGSKFAATVILMFLRVRLFNAISTDYQHRLLWTKAPLVNKDSASSLAAIIAFAYLVYVAGARQDNLKIKSSELAPSVV